MTGWNSKTVIPTVLTDEEQEIRDKLPAELRSSDGDYIVRL